MSNSRYKKQHTSAEDWLDSWADIADTVEETELIEVDAISVLILLELSTFIEELEAVVGAACLRFKASL